MKRTVHELRKLQRIHFGVTENAAFDMFAAMRGLRNIIGQYRALFLLLCVLSLAAKVVLPQGFMLGSSNGTITVMICAESGNAPATIAIPMKADSEKGAMPGKVSEACPYSALAMSGLSATGPELTAAALAFILLLGFAAQAPPLAQRLVRLLPPLRGPPATT